ncbi:MAG: helix-turn-helix domain-containing protein [Armatimonadota bacterium]
MIETLTEHNQQTIESACSLKEILPAFTALAAAYAQRWRIPCALTDSQGLTISGDPGCQRECRNAAECLAAHRRAVDEAVRWGEPSVSLCPWGRMFWMVPVMLNARVLGGLLSTRPESPDAPVLTTRDVRRAAFDLLKLAEEANLTNAALLEMQRLAARRESERAEAIHELKEHNYGSIRDIYLVEEPGLIGAIKRGDRAAAREIINRVLVGIYFVGRDRPLLLKSFLLELVVMMSRSAVEAGGDPTELLGANYSSFAELARIDTEEELCAWLVAMLERVMDAIKASRHYPIGVLLGAAMKYMQDHLHEELSRDDLAQVACLSPSHFSRVVKQAFGQSFTDLLTRMRVDRAREMLVLTEKSLIQICMDCGFSDQSYFSKVFQKVTGRPPSEYRRLHRSTL